MIIQKSARTGASKHRLETFIQERLKPGSNREDVDKRIWDLFGETWCVMFTDLTGFSRMVEEFGIIHFLQTIYESKRIFIPVIDENDGVFLKEEGDSFLVIFRDVKKALTASIRMLSLARKYNATKSDEEKVHICIGLGYGNVLKIGDTDVFGAEVNAASKLGEDIAKAGEIIVTGAVKEQAKKIAGLKFELLKDVNPPGAKEAYRVIYHL